jgi:H+/Na+-translocating ferredoxin:NAD+ oxidoreductase subunit B
VTRPPAVALIAEELCIGCTLCIEACPVDAIVGAARLMHTVIARDCIGCKLCLPPCPVDCISMVETGAQPTRAERLRAAERARQRFELRKTRLESEQHAERAADGGHDTTGVSAKQRTVQRAIERAKLRLAQRKALGNENL